jgi:hypothetical protein
LEVVPSNLYLPSFVCLTELQSACAAAAPDSGRLRPSPTPVSSCTRSS